MPHKYCTVWRSDYRCFAVTLLCYGKETAHAVDATHIKIYIYIITYWYWNSICHKVPNSREPGTYGGCCDIALLLWLINNSCKVYSIIYVLSTTEN